MDDSFVTGAGGVLQTRKRGWAGGIRADIAVLVSIAGRSTVRSSTWGGGWWWWGEAAGRQEDGGAQQPYLARSLLVGGGVGEGDVEKSPGCSGMRASEGGAGGCTLGGVDEVLREEDEPLRDTQEVSITLTPMLQWDRDAQPIKSR